MTTNLAQFKEMLVQPGMTTNAAQLHPVQPGMTTNAAQLKDILVQPARDDKIAAQLKEILVQPARDDHKLS